MRTTRAGCEMTPSRSRPVVVGGGMTGLMLAAALGRRDVACRVLERSASLGEVGAGVQLSPRSVRLLEQVGALEPLRDAAVAITRREIRSWRGEAICGTELGESCASRYGAPYLTVHRADLQQALLACVPAGTVRLAAEVTHVLLGQDAAAVRLARGGLVAGCAVVGADGIRSTVRAALVPDAPVASGLAAYRALVPVARVPAQAAEPVVRIWVGAGAHLVVYPVRAGTLVNVVAVVASPAGSEDWVAPASVADLTRAFRGWDDLALSVLSGVDAVSAWALHDRDPLDRVARGRVVLAGDAAHPMLPFAAQGVNQGLEDGWALAACLAVPDPDGLVRALADYSRVRSPQAAHAQLVARRSASSLHVPDGPLRPDRDAALATGAPLAAQDRLLAPLGWRPSS